MDTQAWLLLVSGLIGGAGGAALINVIYGMKKQKQDRIDEHARWLRDKKLEAYSDFFGESFAAFDGAPLAPPQETAELLEILRKTSVAAQARVRLLAPDPVGELAKDAHFELLEYVKDAVKYESDSPERDEKLANGGRQFMESMSKFLALARNDLDQSQ